MHTFLCLAVPLQRQTISAPSVYFLIDVYSESKLHSYNKYNACIYIQNYWQLAIEAKLHVLLWCVCVCVICTYCPIRSGQYGEIKY